MDTLQSILNFIRETGQYCTARYISKSLGIDLYRLYSTPGFSVPELNAQLGFTRATKVGKAEYENRISEYIRKQKRFVASLEIANEINISRATLRSYEISIDQLNEAEGYSRGYKKQHVTHNKLSDDFVESIRQQMIEKLRDGYLPEHTMYKVLKLKKAALSSYIDYKELVLLCELEDQGLKRLGKTEDIQVECISIIEQAGRYCSKHFLAQKLGISANLLAFRGVNTSELNRSMGYFRDNSCFEAAVGTAFQDLYPNYEIIPQKWFTDLRSDKGCVLYFDFFIPELSIAVEADGPGHSDPRHPWYKEVGLRRDSLKNEYCLRKGLTLVRVPYSHKVDTEYVKSYFPGSPLESLTTTTQSETTDVTVKKCNELGNQQGSLLDISQEEPSTIIPSGSRAQESSKRTGD